MLQLLIPHKKSLNIELYNEKLFNKSPKFFAPLFKHDRATLKFPQELRNYFTTLSELHAETHNFPSQSLIERVDTNVSL